MCLILFSIDQSREFPLVVAANRDEFYDRPTTAMHWWPDQELLAGRDDQSGGTWLAIFPQGLVSAVTNVREGSGEPGQLTRGRLPLMVQHHPTDDLKEHLADNASLYAGFNLLRMTARHGWYYSNRDAHPGRHLHRGTYGLSNHLLQSPWPKLVRLREQLSTIVNHHSVETTKALHHSLIEQLRDDTPAPDSLLPDTGIGLERERFLSPPFIASDYYGTRASTIVSVHRSGDIQVTEQVWLRGGHRGPQQQFQWQAPPGD